MEIVHSAYQKHSLIEATTKKTHLWTDCPMNNWSSIKLINIPNTWQQMQLPSWNATDVFADKICTKKFEKQIKDLRNINSKLFEREVVSNYA